MIRKVLPFASNYLKNSNLKKSVSRFAKTSLLSSQLNSTIPLKSQTHPYFSLGNAFASLTATYNFKFSTTNAGLNLNNSPQSSDVNES